MEESRRWRRGTKRAAGGERMAESRRVAGGGEKVVAGSWVVNNGAGEKVVAGSWVVDMVDNGAACGREGLAGASEGKMEYACEGLFL